MYGSGTTNSQLATVQSFEIVHDQTGVFSYLFRTVHNALQLLRVLPNSLQSPSDTQLAQMWLQLLAQAEPNKVVDAARVVQDLNLSQQSPAN